MALPHPARFRPARALRLEIRHSPVVWALPVLAALFYYNTYRTMQGLPPIWSQSASVVTGPMLLYVCVFAAGLAAWAGTREGRRKTGDLLSTTARAPWARQATVLAATAFWMVLAFLAETAIVYLLTARQATWGGPPLWPVAVGVVGVVTACAIGFTGGALFPSRFTAPIITVAVFALEFVGVKAANNAFDFKYSAGSTYALLVPDQGQAQPQVGVFYHVPPDVYIAQVMFMGGVIPALHDAASDQPVPYTPDCTGVAFQVCIHPAYAGYLDAIKAALEPAAAEIAGLPGAPVRADLAVGDGLPATAGTTSVYAYSGTGQGAGGSWFGLTPAEADSTPGWGQGYQQDFLVWFVSDAPQSFAVNPGPAQQAVAAALLAKIGAPAPQYNLVQKAGTSAQSGPGGAPPASAAQIAAAATRFEALSSAARHAWLATHIAALRSGAITLAQLP